MITCYVLSRHQKNSLCLSPYLDVDRMDDWKEDEEVVLKSSGMLTKSQKDEATYALYSAIDFCVDRWIQNKQYVPRLLICALIFTASYFVLSLAIRDPLPLIDEIAISVGLTLLGWSALAKRDTRSSVAQRRRYELKVRASERQEVIEQQLFVLEEYLDEASKVDALALCNSLCLVSKESLLHFLFEGTLDELSDIAALLFLQVRMSDKALLQTAHTLVRLRKQKRADSRLAARLYHQHMQKRIDLPLLSLLVALDEATG